ncbi:enhancer of mRNA-decapping protein 4 homolog isoform X3 [Hermetia illucens]|uniref:enhancer of mRNA-decapping protein 4 homolog isoform X3 n=1 Tax=Hermetia illucens TaxID=343691 RepID=UPI0018CC5B60|nr:enhancer of mRNA-decapping protein 4 homolog isoform X3 [Hermetia illucens]
MLIVFISAFHLFNDILHRYRRSRSPTQTEPATEQPATMSSSLSKDTRPSQAIKFFGDEDNQCYEITESDIVVYGTKSRSDHGSSKVKLKNIVDYKWEVKNYPGHLIAVHLDGKCVAYVIKGMVRVISGEKRALIKGMTGEVYDIQFAHNEKQRILACAEASMLHIYKVDVLPDNLVCNLLLEIEDPLLNYIPKYDKVSWCPYVPDEASDTDDDASQLLVWSRGNCCHCFNINTVLSSYGNGRHSASSITEGALKLMDNAIIVTWVALSPDGTTLSVGSDDGYIRFYQVYFHEKEPRCLHQWNPHNGKPISSFFFLDNLTKTSADAYWKYALTGANRNTEFKIWDCGTWDCLQILSLRSNETDNLSFIADIDRTASYLIVSSVETSVAYVIQLINDVISTEKTDEDDFEKNANGKSPTEIVNRDDANKKVSVFMKSISEFPLSSPMLSFSIVDASVRKYKCQETESLLAEDLDDYDEENATYCVVVHMFVVQPKSVQDCHIIYQPTVSETAEVGSSLSSGGNYVDVLLDSSGQWNPEEPIAPEKTLEKTEFESFSAKSYIKASKSPKPPLTVPQKSSHPVNLMTPDSFNTMSSETKQTEAVSSEVMSTILMLASVTNSSNANQKSIENMNILNLVNNKVIEDREQQKHQRTNNSQNEFSDSNDNSGQHVCDRLPSGGSSPSREVQQILSINDYMIPQQNKSFYSEKSTTNDNVQRTDVENGSAFGERKFEKNAAKSAGNHKEWSEFSNLPNIPIKHAVQSNQSKADLSDSSELKDVNSKLDRLINQMQNQSLHISELKAELAQVKKQNAELMDNVKRTQYNAEFKTSKLVEDCFGRLEKEHKQRWESLISTRNAQNRELKESVMHLLNQFLFNQFPEKQSNMLTSEVQKQITSVIMAKLDVIEQHFQNEISQKLTTTDKILKENIAQVCRSKNIIDAFGNSVVAGVQNGLQNAYVHSMSNTLIPAYEKSSREMFKQLHETFSLGIKEVMEQFDSYLCQIQPMKAKFDDMWGKIENFHKYLDTVLVEQRANGNNNCIEIKKELKSLESNIVRVVTDIIQKEVRKNFETQAASLEDSVLSAVRSQAHTPAPSMYDVQDQIKFLLFQGQINKAFHQALIANDLTLVEYTLEKADHKAVFHPCVLEQTVLLSLIQQISADMDNHTAIKQQYLSDAICNLTHNDPITKEHAPRVLRELYKNCQNFLANYPKSTLSTGVKMAMMAITGMVPKVL